MATRSEEDAADKCPVDHKTRAAWLQANSSSTTTTTTWNPPAGPETPRASHGSSSDSSQIEQPPPTAPPAPKSRFASWFDLTPNDARKRKAAAAAAAAASIPPPPSTLSLEREISTIPRASVVEENPRKQAPNSEKEGGVSESGNWIYPSERMFFEAMARKGFKTEAENMRTIVPIHNAVNERAWKEIKEWEKPWGAVEKCGGPRLDSFQGLSNSLSPKARFNTLLGYTAPFDRHDWIVDRCGTKVEYIIDFYAGKDDGKGKLSFYLDVRPKLNSVEGWKMRASRALGLV